MRIIYTILQRIGYFVPTLLGLIILTFFITYYIPADPVAAAAGQFADAQMKAKIAQRYGFDKPVPVQFFLYMKRLLKGDLGESVYTRRDISDEIRTRFAATLELVITSLLVAILLGIPIGVISATKRNTVFDHLLRGVTIAGIALATFWIGIEFQLFFGYKAGMFPLTGRLSGTPPSHITGFYLVDSILTRNGGAFWDTLRHLILPVITLSIGNCATIIRFTRAGVLNALNSDYVIYERAMGLSWRLLIFKYVLRNALVATVAQVGMLFGYMLASGFVVETVFSWAGIGAFAVQSILMMDYNAVMGVAIWAGVAYGIGNLLADVALIVIDPREISK